MDLTLTINGNRNLLVPNISEQLASNLKDPNREFQITLTVSPVGENIKYGEGEEQDEVVRKVGVIFVDNIVEIQK